MARADGAHASVCVEATRELGCTAQRPAVFGLSTFGISHLEIWVRRAVPAMVALFAGALVAISLVITRDAYDRALTDAFTDLERSAAAISSNLKTAFQEQPRPGVAAALAQTVPSRALAHRQQVIVSDAAGNIIGAAPALSSSNLTLNDYLGPSQPLTVFAEKAGVLRIELADGSEALASVHTLAPPFGQAAVIYPLTAILADWEATSFRAAVLVVCTVTVLIALALAYFWQASRAREANQLCERMQARVDTALGRGRCGLWDWDLARGRIYWSDSMYEILGMTSAGQFLSFGDINALVHPQDGDLAIMAEMLASSQADFHRSCVPDAECEGRVDLAQSARRTCAGRAGRTPASRWNRRRHHRAKSPR